MGLRTLTPEIRITLTLLILGAALRLAFLGSNPPGLFRDEAEKVYTAWSLGLTGGYHHLVMEPDVRGVMTPHFERLGPPLFVDAYGSWTSAIYHWATVPFALALGPSPWAARLVAALVGFLTLLVTWRYARRAFDAEVAILALFFLAISPWHVLFSRWAQQGIFVPLWLALGLWIFERGRLAAGRPWWIAGICFGLAFYSYAPMRLTVPLLMIALLIGHRHDLIRNRQAALIAALALVATVAPTAIWLGLHRSEGFQRWGNVSIWHEGATVNSAVRDFIGNYLSHFSIPFLFISGDANPRHSIPGFGQMHWIELPGLLIALVLALTRRRPQEFTLALWFLLAPIAPSLTRDSPHALRSIASIPAAHLLSAVGTAQIFRGLVSWAHASLPPARKRMRAWQEMVIRNVEGIRSTGLLLGGVTALLFSLQLFLRFPTQSAEAWEARLHDAIREAAEVSNGTSPIFVTAGDQERPVLYLPTHLRAALRENPRDLGEIAPYLPSGWNQCGQGPASPAALWERFRGGIFLTLPGEIRADGEPMDTLWSPENRFSPISRPLWEIHASGRTQTTLESGEDLP